MPDHEGPITQYVEPCEYEGETLYALKYEKLIRQFIAINPLGEFACIQDIPELGLRDLTYTGDTWNNVPTWDWKLWSIGQKVEDGYLSNSFLGIMIQDINIANPAQDHFRTIVSLINTICHDDLARLLLSYRTNLTSNYPDHYFKGGVLVIANPGYIETTDEGLELIHSYTVEEIKGYERVSLMS